MKALFFLLIIIPSLCWGEDYSLLLDSSKCNMEEGAENLTTGYNLFNRTIEYIPLKERAVTRIAKGLLLDLPICIWITVLHHEYFGHGGRARELDVTASYKLYSPWEYWPWGDKRACTFYKKGYPKGIDQRLSLTVGGIEANQVLAHRLERRLFKRGDIHHYEALLFLVNKSYINTYIYRTPDPDSDPEGFRVYGDISAYLIDMDIKRGGEGSVQSVIDDYGQLRKDALWNLVDPFFLISIYSIGRHLVLQRGPLHIPMFNYKSTKFLPSARFNITQLGEEFYLDLHIKRGTSFLTVYLRDGKGPEGRFWGGGIEMDDKPIGETFLVGGQIDWWHQPITEDGYHLMTNATKHITKQIAFTIKIGLKSKGYLMGKEFDQAGYGACGIDLVF